MTKTKTVPRLDVPKTIIRTGQVLEALSYKLATDFAFKLFVTPIKYKLPKREDHMEAESIKNYLPLEKFKTEIRVLTYGCGEKKALLVHGWSGRGTQMVSIADALVKKGYQVISFDAPAHGQSEGKVAYMTMFIESILQIGEVYGKFDLVIGHSLGGMSTINAVRLGFKVDQVVTIGAGDRIIDVFKGFIESIQLKPIILKKLYTKFERKLGESLNKYDTSNSAPFVKVPTLIIHDENDLEVPVFCAKNIVEKLPDAQLIVTQGLGHRKVLGDKKVIQTILAFAK